MCSIAGLSVAFCAAGIWVGYLASVIGSNLQASLEQSISLEDEISKGNLVGARDIAVELRENTRTAKNATNDPLWKVARYLPFAGPNIVAVSEVAVSANDVIDGAVMPLFKEYESLNMETLSPLDGRIDVEQVRKAAPTLGNAFNTVRLTHERLSEIEPSALIPQIATPLQAAIEKMQDVSNILESASIAAELLPPMLGVDNERNYLLLIQNSAEARATGGIPGALAIVSANEGRVSLGEQSSAGALGSFSPKLDVDPEQELIFTSRLGIQMQNVNLTPDFPTAAQTAGRMWEQRHGGQGLDGVIALDPVVLSHLLAATGPAHLSDPAVLNLISGTSLPTSLNNENVIPTLLSDVYEEIESPAAQDAYFAAVAGEVFRAFTEGRLDSKRLLKALTVSVEERRLYLWSSHEDEQKIVASTPLAGSVTGSGSGGASFGVYFNDGTGAKMDFYITRSVKIIQACPVDGYGIYTVRVTATNNAPADAGTSLPAYVTGGNVFGVKPGRIRTNYVVYGPSKAFVEKAIIDGKPVPVSSGKHDQRPVGMVPLELGPGETSTIDMIFSEVVQDSVPQLRVTPTIQSPEDVVRPLERAACG